MHVVCCFLAPLFLRARKVRTKEKQRIETDIAPPQITITSSDIKDKQGIIEGLVLDNINIIYYI